MENTTSEEPVTCPICFEEIETDCLMLFDNCTHKLCKDCYEEHLKSSNKCPVCRTSINDDSVVISDCLKLLETRIPLLGATIRKLKSVNSWKTYLNNENNASVLAILKDNVKSLMKDILESGIPIPPEYVNIESVGNNNVQTVLRNFIISETNNGAITFTDGHPFNEFQTNPFFTEPNENDYYNDYTYEDEELIESTEDLNYLDYRLLNIVENANEIFSQRRN